VETHRGENHEFLVESDVKGNSYFPITLDFCRLQPTRCCYLKEALTPTNFSTGYNPQEAPTLTGYNFFFIKLQLERRLQSPNNNTKSSVLVT